MNKEEIINWWKDWYKAETGLVMPEIAKKRMGQHLDKFKPKQVKSSLGDVSGCFTLEQMKQAYMDGVNEPKDMIGFDINNYR